MINTIKLQKLSNGEGRGGKYFRYTVCISTFDIRELGWEHVKDLECEVRDGGLFLRAKKE